MPRPDPDRHHQLRRRRRDRGSARPPSTSRRCSTRSASSASSTRPSRAAPTSSRAGAARGPGDAAAAARPPRRRTRPTPTDWKVDPFSGEIHDGYLWGRGAVDMKDFDAMLLSRRARPRPRPAPSRRARSCSCFTADEEAGGHTGAELLVDEPRPTCSRAAPRPSARSAASAPPSRGRRIYLIEAAEKGMAWMRLTASGQRRPRVDAQPRQRRHRAGRGGRRGSARHEWPVRLTPTMEVPARRPSASSPAPRPPRQRRGAGRGVRPRRADARRGHPQHHQPDDARAPATRSTSSRPRRPRTSTAGSCRATRTSSSPRSRELVGDRRHVSSFVTKQDAVGDAVRRRRWSTR